MMKVGLAGLGTVGAAVAAWLVGRGADAGLRLTAVSARDRDRARGCDLAQAVWCDDPCALATGADIVVEVIGGADGVALDIARRTLTQGKSLVTANKAMLARHGAALGALAAAHGGTLRYEAAVCGAVPIVKLLSEGLAGNKIASIRGILNGTCNFILTRMDSDGTDFATALAEAQKRGYAEADPAADIDGHDAACKLALLAALAFGGAPDLAGVAVSGIRDVTPQQLAEARARGGVLRLVGQAVVQGGRLAQTVGLEVLPLADPLAAIGGVTNAVTIDGDLSGPVMIQGAGAGGRATASAVIADLIDIRRCKDNSVCN